MPIFDFVCENCGHEFDMIVSHETKETMCRSCSKTAKRVFPRKAPSIELKYNPVTDLCDWDGNRSKYWDQYKQDKSDGKDVRIPKHDGDG